MDDLTDSSEDSESKPQQLKNTKIEPVPYLEGKPPEEFSFNVMKGAREHFLDYKH